MPNGQQPAVAGLTGNFNAATSLSQYLLETKARVSGGRSIWNIPRVGYLSYIDIPISVVVSGTVGTVHALGGAGIVRRVKVNVNNIGAIVDITGIGYHYALRNYIGDYKDPVSGSNARAAITATTMNVDMRIPVAFNDRDPLALLLLQNEQTLGTLEIEWETDANITSSGTIAAVNVQPAIYYLNVPENPQDRAPVKYIQQILEDDVAISGAGQFPYDVPRGGILTHLLLGCGFAAGGGADHWSSAQLKLQQAYTKWDITPALADIQYAATHPYNGRAALPSYQRERGLIPFDFSGSSGLGRYGIMRDAMDSRNITYLRAVLTATQSETLYAVRVQIAQLMAQ